MYGTRPSLILSPMMLLLALGLAAVPAAAQFRTATPAVRPVTPTVPALSLSAPTLSGASNLLKSSGVERAPLPTLPSPHGRLPTVHTPSMVQAYALDSGRAAV